MVLNLANQELSQIKYEVINFSDTQKLLKLKTNLYENGEEGVVRIVSRFQWADLQVLIQACAIIKDTGNNVVLHLPYMLGARSDRNFDYEHEAHYMGAVIAPAINNLGAVRVFSIDPHSTVVEGCIKGFRPLSIIDTLVDKAVKDIPADRHFCIVPPDVGAEKRASEAAKKVVNDSRFEGIVQCTKHRDIATGNILHTEVLGTPNGLDCIIVDDLCDGGRTFIEVSKALKAKGAENVYLCVPHGLFSYGFKPLVGSHDADKNGDKPNDSPIKKIYTTNSYQSMDSMMGIWFRDSYGEKYFSECISITDVCI